MYKVYKAIDVRSVDQLNQEKRFVYILPVVHQNDSASSHSKKYRGSYIKIYATVGYTSKIRP